MYFLENSYPIESIMQQLEKSKYNKVPKDQVVKFVSLSDNSWKLPQV